jgi:hypothetical protein
MRKDNIRDYATAAFRFYAQYGSYEAYKKAKVQMIAEDLAQHDKLYPRKRRTSSPIEAQMIKAEKKYNQEYYAEIEDVKAVERTLFLISKDPNGEDIKRCIEEVYFKDSDKPFLEKGDIQARVDSLAEKAYLCERQIYRNLAKARLIFASERGLRILK